MKIDDEVRIGGFKNEVHRLQVNVQYTSAWIKNQFEQSLKPYGISTEQFQVLRILRTQHPKHLCLKDITERMIYKNSNTTRIIEKLERKELVIRKQSPDDKRELNIFITERGLRLLFELDSVWKGEVALVSTPLSEQEAKVLNGLLDKMRGEQSI